MRIAFDYGGVLSKRSDVWVPMIRALIAGGAEVFVMTDMGRQTGTLRNGS